MSDKFPKERGVQSKIRGRDWPGTGGETSLHVRQKRENTEEMMEVREEENVEFAWNDLHVGCSVDIDFSQMNYGE